MPRLTIALAPDGLLVPALLGLDAIAMQDLVAQGQSPPRPMQVRGQIDTGSLVTAVVPSVLAAIGATPGASSRTQTAAGFAIVQHYLVSFTIYDPMGSKLAVARTSWAVTNLPQDLADVDVLFGMDLMRELVLMVDGPGGLFSLDF